MYRILKINTMEKIRFRLVYNRRKQLNAQGTALIQVEASLQKRKVYFSTRIYIKPEHWDKCTSSIINHPHAIELNTWIYEYILNLEGFELSLWKRGITPTLLQLKEAVKKNRTSELTFESFASSAIDNSKRKSGTKCNLHGTLTMLNDFRPGYTWEDLTYTLLRDFENWLLNRGSAINTVAKHLQNIRTLVNEAISAGYMSADEDPFRSYTIKHERVPHRFLNPEELKKMENVQVTGKYAHVRDAFLFCCYTGLRFSDFKHLKEDYFQKIKGQTWLMLKTEKTGYDVKIPLYLMFSGKALDILSRYQSLSDFVRIGCNADTNRYLATLQKLARIKTRTTFHTARHTCATLLCHQGVPITTVQRILGHTKLTTTQLYSEVMADTIVRDLSNVRKNGKKWKVSLIAQ